MDYAKYRIDSISDINLIFHSIKRNKEEIFNITKIYCSQYLINDHFIMKIFQLQNNNLNADIHVQ